MKNKHFALLLVWYSVLCFMCLVIFLPLGFVHISIECLLIKQNLNKIRLFFTGILLGNITYTARICCTFVCAFTVGTVILHLIDGKYPENIKVKLH